MSTEPNYIIVVDLSEHPARIALVHFQNGKAYILNKITVSFDTLISSESGEDESKEKISYDYLTEDENYSEEISSVNIETKLGDNTQISPGNIIANHLMELNIKVPLDELPCVTILPTRSFFSLEISLPFTDRKKIEKILTLQAQDLCPFDIESFILVSRYLSEKREKESNFSSSEEFKGTKLNVSGMERHEIKNALQICLDAGLQPRYLVSPANVLTGFSGIVSGEPSLYSYIVLFSGQSFTAIAVFKNNHLIREHVFPARVDSPEAKQLIRCSVAEAKEDSKIELYVIGDLRLPFNIDDAEIIHVECDGAWSLSQCAATALVDPLLARDLSNFRSGEFRLNLLATNMRSLIPALAPTVFACAFLVTIILSAIYGVRAIRINKLQNDITAITQQNVPIFKSAPGEERANLLNQLELTKQQLSELGNPSQRTALATLGDIAKFFPHDSQVSIRKLVINGDRVTIEGTVPKYENLDRLKERLRRKRKIFCSIDSRTTGGQRDGKSFSFDIRMCVS